MKSKQKKVLIWTIKKIPLICFIVISSFSLDYVIGKCTIEFITFMDNPVHQYSIAEVKVARADEIKEIPMRLWVLNAFNEAGLDVNKADRIIECESHYNENAINFNSNKSFDAGIFQLNSVHKDITLKDKIDYKTATAYVIKKVKRDKGWSAWVCNNLIN